MQPNLAALNPPLSPSQVDIVLSAQLFMRANAPPVEAQLKQSSWQDMLAIISHPQVDNETRVVCCSVLKWLVYEQSFVSQPLQVFKGLLQLYATRGPGQDYEPTKAQSILEIVLKAIPTIYLKDNQRYELVQWLLAEAQTHLDCSLRVMNIILLILEHVDGIALNNEVTAGEILLFLEKLLSTSEIDPNLRSLLVMQCIKILQNVIDIVNEEDEIERNEVQTFLESSSLAKRVLTQIIVSGAENRQIITASEQINQVKHAALELYSAIWYCYLDEDMFGLCLSSLLGRPKSLVDSQASIMERIVVMLQRSLNHQAYQSAIYPNMQQILISLMGLLAPKQSYLDLAERDPEEFVEMLQDLCMEQHREQLETRVCWLIASLCMYIDGCMSFLGSMCIMYIKKFNSSLEQIPQSQSYIETIDAFWEGSHDQKVGTCVLMLCVVSDQLSKRSDLTKPLVEELKKMNELFKIDRCKLPVYLICRFMYLYSFQTYQGCMDVFLPYQRARPVYEHQLQACYRIMERYYGSARQPELALYVQQIGNHVILSSKLTPLLESCIVNGKIEAPAAQFRVLEQLVLWLDRGIQDRNMVVCSKMANLVTILIDRINVDNYEQTEEAIFGYLEPLFRRVMTSDGQHSEQFLLQISVAFIRRFPSLEKSPQQLQFFVDLAISTVHRNNGVLNSCLDFFYELTKYLGYSMVLLLVDTYLKCLAVLDREEDLWECYFGLEACMIRIGELGKPVPLLDIKSMLARLGQHRSSVLRAKAFMFLLSLVAAEPGSPHHYQSHLVNQPLPVDVPPYENRPYLLYLLSFAQHISMSPDYARDLLLFILSLIEKEKTVPNMLKKYESKLYNAPEKQEEAALNAFAVYGRLSHPLIRKNIDVFEELRKCWDKYPYRTEILSTLTPDKAMYLRELLTTETKGRYRQRKIFKIKDEQPEPPVKEDDKEGEMG